MFGFLVFPLSRVVPSSLFPVYEIFPRYLWEMVFEIRFQLINQRDYKFGNSFTFCTILITFYLFIFISFWLSRIYPMPLQTNGQLYFFLFFFFYFLNVLTYSFYGRPVSRHCANQESEVIELVTRHLYILYMYICLAIGILSRQWQWAAIWEPSHHW